jgi:hypothetical protein
VSLESVRKVVMRDDESLKDTMSISFLDFLSKKSSDGEDVVMTYNRIYIWFDEIIEIVSFVRL